LEKYLCKLVVVSGNVTKSPGGCFLYTGVEFFEADDESIKGATVDNLKNGDKLKLQELTVWAS